MVGMPSPAKRRGFFQVDRQASGLKSHRVDTRTRFIQYFTA